MLELAINKDNTMTDNPEQQAHHEIARAIMACGCALRSLTMGFRMPRRQQLNGAQRSLEIAVEALEKAQSFTLELQLDKETNT